VDDVHAIAHNKIILIDGETILTGSFNFTKAAEGRNAENLLVLKGFPDLVRQYEENYKLHKAHSGAYGGRAEQAMEEEEEEPSIQSAHRKGRKGRRERREANR